MNPAYELACRNRATYLAATFSVDMEMMKPTIPTQIGPTMCQNLSWQRSACKALMRETMQEKAHGGALIRSVGT
jgi:hypothetical protein